MSTVGFLLLIAALLLAVVLVIGFIASVAGRSKDSPEPGEWPSGDSDRFDGGGDSGGGD
ncbi:hypothetical protein [Nocardia harenae]|uniref:hypothetical protein n=1 Tax=Nocardia harenae TaxID=358707 RepID=UPI000A64FD45|nr:hypothetical protein [Nocardia harenae]